ncbi:uncharacterized protein [Cicer arietinum]|uniref:uncharacterized protein n=1 Tax=Cicer arietinum TaxID=3827 RepID=UPI003CC66050
MDQGGDNNEEMCEGMKPDFEEMYQIPLFEIIGVTYTEMTFYVGFAYLQSECADNFTRTLQMFKEHITSGEVEVIVTDRDLALMNVVEYGANNGGMGVYSYDEAQYYMKLTIFEGICSSCYIFYDYVHEYWLIPQKERFVVTWTNKVMHFGNTTTQRVESVYWIFKRILQDSIGDICSVLETINSIVILQHNEIITSFEKSIIQKVHRYSNRLYANLYSVVSKNTIDHIVANYDHVKYVGIDQTECCCTIRTTHGLPYACEIPMYSMIPRSITLDAIQVWWSKLSFHDDG